MQVEQSGVFRCSFIKSTSVRKPTTGLKDHKSKNLRCGNNTKLLSRRQTLHKMTGLVKDEADDQYKDYVRHEIAIAGASQRIVLRKGQKTLVSHRDEDKHAGRQTCLPPLAPKQPLRILPYADVERATHCTSKTSEALPRFSTEKTRSVKQRLEQKKLDLSYIENTKTEKLDLSEDEDTRVIFRRPPSVPPKQMTFGRVSDLPGTDRGPYCAADTLEALPRLSTENTRSIRQRLEKNKLDLSENEDARVIYRRPPSDPPKQMTFGRVSDPAGTDRGPYCSARTGEALPRLSTVRTRLIRQRLEQNKLDLSYIENTQTESKQVVPLPPIAPKQMTFGRVSDLPGTDRGPYCAADTLEALPRFSTVKTRLIRQRLEKNKLDLSYIENTKTESKQVVPLPPIVPKQMTFGRVSDPAGTDRGSYCAAHTGEALPRLCTDQTRLIRQKQEKNKIDLSFKENKMRPRVLPPIPQKPTRTGQPVEGPLCCEAITVRPPSQLAGKKSHLTKIRTGGRKLKPIQNLNLDKLNSTPAPPTSSVKPRTGRLPPLRHYKHPQH